MKSCMGKNTRHSYNPKNCYCHAHAYSEDHIAAMLMPELESSKKCTHRQRPAEALFVIQFSLDLSQLNSEDGTVFAT